MSQTKSTKTIQLTVPSEFYEVLEKISLSYKASVEEYVLDEMIGGLDCDLEESAGPVLGLTDKRSYRDQLEEMFSPAQGVPA